MSFPKLYLSRPGVAFPSNRYNNNDILALVRKEYTGSSDGWTNIHAAIQKVFDKCNTQYRYLDFDADSRVAQYAVKSVEHCVSQNRLTLKEIIDDIDLVIFGGIAREYFEPATAMEVAATLGIKETHAFDVTTACVGHLEALQVGEDVAPQVAHDQLAHDLHEVALAVEHQEGEGEADQVEHRGTSLWPAGRPA